MDHASCLLMIVHLFKVAMIIMYLIDAGIPLVFKIVLCVNKAFQIVDQIRLDVLMEYAGHNVLSLMVAQWIFHISAQIQNVLIH